MTFHIPHITGWSQKSEFERLLRPHIRHLYRMAYRFTGHADDAEELVQELLVKLYSKTAELRRIDRLRPWLTRALYRQFVDDHRKQSRRPLGLLDEVETGPDGEDAFDTMPSPEPGPDARADQDDLRASLHAALDRLDPHHRSVIALHDMEGYSLQELVTILETPLGTLKSRLHRARQRLRELITMEPPTPAVRVSE